MVVDMALISGFSSSQAITRTVVFTDPALRRVETSPLLSVVAVELLNVRSPVALSGAKLTLVPAGAGFPALSVTLQLMSETVRNVDVPNPFRAREVGVAETGAI